MSLYAMGDLHLCKSVSDKPMDVFGAAWENYMEKISQNCRNVLTADDTLLICGDISWATYAKDLQCDLEFIENLPGKKIISKGNHDYWWTSAKKLSELKKSLNLATVDFLHNNFFAYNGAAVCGNRGWTKPDLPEDKKIYDRELIRLELSLKAAQNAGFDKKIVMTHYPPCYDSSTVFDDYLALFEQYGVQLCVYGHLHRSFSSAFIGTKNNIKFQLVSADYLQFMPFKIM